MRPLPRLMACSHHSDDRFESPNLPSRVLEACPRRCNRRTRVRRKVFWLEKGISNIIRLILKENKLKSYTYFQQDEYPPHTSRVAHAVLNYVCPINYPPRSLDFLTVLDYYLWERIKDFVYRERPTTRDDMIRRITEAIRSLDANKILYATNSFQSRVEKWSF
ncbi:hypothetical protein ALC53_13706 [Atta colombica]|uniref:Histone-lysine N-methyltransferase SETMAR n=1 Tax=Atta colombica TaxID=520822 RepID=A0A195ATT9_9HYME|nr:hypothetical protein ALC53_13706 [Atta colombica]